MKNYKYAKISSKHTTLSFVGIFFAIFILPIIGIGLLYAYSLNHQTKFLIIGLAFFAGTIYIAYWLKNMAYVKIIENKFHIKKVFRRLEVIDIRELKAVKTYTMGKDVYIRCLLNKNGLDYSLLVYASYSVLYYDEDIQTEKLLQDILEENKQLNSK